MPITVNLKERPARLLHFDLENRPLSYMGGDYTSSEITAIAASWSDQKKIHSWILGEDNPTEMLLGFLSMYEKADIVTGHYIRGHDLPILNGALLENGLPTLSAKMVSDTCSDLVKRSGISKSQESLAAMYGLEAPKFHLTQQDWRDMNRLTPRGLKLVRQRAETDIVQHKQLRAELIRFGALRENRLWTP